MSVLDGYARFRAMTTDLLSTLDENSLRFAPGRGLGPLWQQFRHLGRIEDNYAAAITTGRIVFGPSRRRCAGTAADALTGYLRDLDEDLCAAVTRARPDCQVDWFGERIELTEHIARLVNHEILHHGQLIVYIRMLKREFPGTWQIWGL